MSLSISNPKKIANAGFNPVIQCLPNEHQLAFLRTSTDSGRSQLVVRNFTGLGATTMSGIVIDQVESYERIVAYSCGSNAFVYAIDGDPYLWNLTSASVNATVTDCLNNCKFNEHENYSKKRLVWVSPSYDSKLAVNTCTEPSYEYLLNPKGQIIGMDFVINSFFVYIWNEYTKELHFYCRTELNGDSTLTRVQTVTNLCTKPVIKNIENTFDFIIGWDTIGVLELPANPVWAFWKDTQKECQLTSFAVYSFTTNTLKKITNGEFSVNGIDKIIQIDGSNGSNGSNSSNGSNGTSSSSRPYVYAALINGYNNDKDSECDSHGLNNNCSIVYFSVNKDSSNIEIIREQLIELPFSTELNSVGCQIFPQPSGKGFLLVVGDFNRVGTSENFQIRVFNHLGYETMPPIWLKDVMEYAITGNYMCYGSRSDELLITKLDFNVEDHSMLGL